MGRLFRPALPILVLCVTLIQWPSTASAELHSVREIAIAIDVSEALAGSPSASGITRERVRDYAVEAWRRFLVAAGLTLDPQAGAIVRMELVLSRADWTLEDRRRNQTIVVGVGISSSTTVLDGGRTWVPTTKLRSAATGDRISTVPLTQWGNITAGIDQHIVLMLGAMAQGGQVSCARIVPLLQDTLPEQKFVRAYSPPTGVLSTDYEVAGTRGEAIADVMPYCDVASLLMLAGDSRYSVREVSRKELGAREPSWRRDPAVTRSVPLLIARLEALKPWESEKTDIASLLGDIGTTAACPALIRLAGQQARGGGGEEFQKVLRAALKIKSPTCVNGVKAFLRDPKVGEFVKEQVKDVLSER